MSNNSKSNAGRPTVITPKVVSQLEALLSVGLTVREACLESGISHEAYYSHARSDEQFADKMANAQNNLTNTAKKIIAYKLMDHDAKTAMWWLERLDKKEIAKLQAKEPQVQCQADEDQEPASMEDLIQDFTMYQAFIATKYELERDANGGKPLPSEYYSLSKAERCQIALEEYKSGSWKPEK